MTKIPTLSDRQTDLTRSELVSAAITLLETEGAGALTLRAAAQLAGITERTLYRHFPTKEDFFAAVGGELSLRIGSTSAPEGLDDLLMYPQIAFSRFDKCKPLVEAALHSTLDAEVKAVQGKALRTEIQGILAKEARHRVPAAQKRAAAIITYFLLPATWRYFRVETKMSLADTIACSRGCIKQTLEGLGILSSRL